MNQNTRLIEVPQTEQDEYRLIGRILAAYGLGEPVTLYRPGHGILNRSWLVQTGDHGYFIKEYRYRDDARIRAEHEVLRALANQPVPVPHLYTLPGGSSLLDLDGTWYAVWDWAQGNYLEHPIVTAAQAEAFGKTLGGLHRVLQALPVPFEAIDRYLAWDSAELVQGMVRLRDLAQAVKDDPFAQQALLHCAEVEQCIAEGLPPYRDFAWMPTQIIHADPSPENMYFDANHRVTAIFDWELVSVRPRAWDIIRAINYMLPDSQVPGGVQIELATPLIAGYHAANPLSEREVAATPDLYYFARVHDLWVYEEHFLRGRTRTDVLAPGRLAELRWYRQNRDRLRRAMLDGVIVDSRKSEGTP